MTINHFDESSSNQITHFGDLGSTNQCDQLYFAMWFDVAILILSWMLEYQDGLVVGVNQD